MLLVQFLLVVRIEVNQTNNTFDYNNTAVLSRLFPVY